MVKLKTNRVLGQCLVKGCTKKTPIRRAKWCGAHKVEVRREQLAKNNAAWMKRRAEGKAGHRLKYKGKPTKWAKLVEFKRRSKTRRAGGPAARRRAA